MFITFWGKYLLFFLLPLTLFEIYRFNKKVNSQTGEKAKETDGGMWKMFVTGLVVALAYHYYGSGISLWQKSVPIYQPAMLSQVRPTETLPRQNEPKQEEVQKPARCGVVSIGINPIRKSDFFDIISVDKNDPQTLEFTVKYYLWDGTSKVAEFKGERCGSIINGTWRQHDDAGTWTVVASTSEKNTYEGEHFSKKLGKNIHIKVVLED